MKKLIFLLAISVHLLMATKTFFPKRTISSNGRPLPVKTVIVYPTGTTSNGITLTHHAAGEYYTEQATVTDQSYDMWYNGILYLSAVKWGSTVTVIGTGDLIWADTTAMKNSSADTLGTKGYNRMKNYEGTYVLIDSTYPEDNAYVFGNAAAAKQWLKVDAMQNQNLCDTKGFVDPTLAPFFAYDDSTNAIQNNKRINYALDSAYTWGVDYIHMPPGTFLIDPWPDSTSGDASATDWYGLRMNPGQILSGSGEPTKLYMSDTVASFIIVDAVAAAAVVFNKRNYTVKDMHILGTKPYDATVSSATRSSSTGAGIGLSGVNWSTTINRVVVENVIIEKIRKEAVKSVFSQQVVFRDVIARNNNFVALTSAAQHTEVSNCLIDSGFAAIEYYGRELTDSLSTFKVNNVTATNMYDYGIRVYGGDVVSINHFHYSGPDTGTYTTESAPAGIWVTPLKEYAPNGVGEINISNSTIQRSGYYGIHLGGSPTDTGFVALSIENTYITDNYHNGISVSMYTADDDTGKAWTGKVAIKNSFIWENNTGGTGSLGAQQVVIEDTDNLDFFNNVVYKSTGSNVATSPLYLKNADSSRITHNNFTTDATNAIVYQVDSTTTGTILSYNDGMEAKQNAHGFFTAPATYTFKYQTAFEDSIAQWVGGSTIAYRTFVLNADSLVTVEYNASGVAQDTTCIDGCL